MTTKKDEWAKLASRELKGKPLENLNWQTPEGINVKPVYSADDLSGLDHLDGMPGIAPFLRGPRATKYTGRPWTIRQDAGFSTAGVSHAVYRRGLAGGRPSCSPRGCSARRSRPSVSR